MVDHHDKERRNKKWCPAWPSDISAGLAVSPGRLVTLVMGAMAAAGVTTAMLALEGQGSKLYVTVEFGFLTPILNRSAYPSN